MTFTAIDFETAHPKRWSICQVGLVRVENGKITKKISMLIQPPVTFNTKTLRTLRFTKKCCLVNLSVLSVLVLNFIICLRHTLEYYDLAQPKYEPACTLKIYKKKLNIACAEHGIPLKHHDALSDAMGCAELYRRWLGVRGDV